MVSCHADRIQLKRVNKIDMNEPMREDLFCYIILLRTGDKKERDLYYKYDVAFVAAQFHNRHACPYDREEIFIGFAKQIFYQMSF